MYKYHLISLLIVISAVQSTGAAQSTLAGVGVDEVPVYELASEVVMWNCSSASDAYDPATARRSPSDLRPQFRVMEQSSEYVMVRFLRWRGSGEWAQALNERIVGDEQPKYWCFRQADVGHYVTIPLDRSARFVTNLVVVPYKIRLGFGDAQFDFEADVSLALGFGFSKARTRTIRLGGILAIGPSIVDVSELDSRRGALSLAAGFTASFSGVEIGFMVGVDLLANRGAIDWADHGMPWIGVSLGTSLIRSSTTEEEQSTGG